MTECLRDQCDKLAEGFVLVNVTDTPERRQVLRDKCHVMAREIGLTEEDRHELAIQVVGKDHSPSWRTFKYPELERLADYLAGFGFIATILRDRRPT